MSFLRGETVTFRGKSSRKCSSSSFSLSSSLAAGGGAEGGSHAKRGIHGLTDGFPRKREGERASGKEPGTASCAAKGGLPALHARTECAGPRNVNGIMQSVLTRDTRSCKEIALKKENSFQYSPLPTSQGSFFFSQVLATKKVVSSSPSSGLFRRQKMYSKKESKKKVLTSLLSFSPVAVLPLWEIMQDAFSLPSFPSSSSSSLLLLRPPSPLSSFLFLLPFLLHSHPGGRGGRRGRVAPKKGTSVSFSSFKLCIEVAFSKSKNFSHFSKKTNKEK